MKNIRKFGDLMGLCGPVLNLNHNHSRKSLPGKGI
jgi:hypothetical protein